jgi:hypothetical protein
VAENSTVEPSFSYFEGKDEKCPGTVWKNII